MDKELKAKWITALRSGEYKQGMYYLYDRRANTYCCLGVLGCLVGRSLDEMEGQSALEDPPYEFLWDLLPKGDGRYLAHNMNDDGKTFAEIADHIERTL